MLFNSSSYWLFMIPGFILVSLAQAWVSSTYRKWSQIRNQYGISGVEAARRLLNSANLPNVDILRTQGQLTDHYDPRRKSLSLSQGVGEGNSVASLAIAAHEIGHAIQDAQGYMPLQFRAALVPIVKLGSGMGWIFLIVGLILGGTLGNQLAWIGVGAFALGAVFALATIPVELNASSRARALLTQSGLVSTSQELQGVSAVLNAAAFTYIAALAASLLQLLYYVSLLGGFGRRRR
ncbi:MAG: zinc metallopeptidase [Chloroflexi bacterium RBG_16_48_8]|nr:MAG: zinc metallopeptidase [Chloroflexi bacterium RBG_16_48_8]